MAAGTVTDADANQNSIWRASQKAHSYNAQHPLSPSGLKIFRGEVSLATTQLDDVGDETYFFRFPKVAYLSRLQVQLTDCDTNATPTLVVDFNTDDGTTEVTYINNSDIGQAGGFDELDLGINTLGKNVKNQYLSMKVVTAAATPAAGTLIYKVEYYAGSRDKVTTW
jgi:hypothetical protein